MRLDLICSTCGHAFELETAGAVHPEARRCPRCGSDSTRQTFASCLRNAPLLDPNWGRGPEYKGFG